MTFILLLLYFSNQFRYTRTQICNLNPEYGKTISSSSPIFLCKTAGCNADFVQYLQNIQYFGCITKSNDKTTKSDVRLKVIRKSQEGLVPISCFENGWVTVVGSQPCIGQSQFTFVPYLQIQTYDVYLISCGGVEEEIPYAGAPRIQIYGYDVESPDTLANTHVFFPTQMIKCVANCVELRPVFTVSPASSHITIAGNIFTINTNNINSRTHIDIITTKCTAGTKTLPLKFYIANNITGDIVSHTGTKHRNPDLYDAGELVSCYVTGISTKVNKSGTPPQASMALVTLDSSNVINKYYTDQTLNQIEIPEGLPSDQTFYYYCFFGNASTRNVFQIKLEKIYIGSIFKTKLKSNSNAYTFDFTPGTKIWCDNDYYSKLNTTANFNSVSITSCLYIVYPSNVSYPMSHLANFVDRQWDNSTTGELIFTRKFPNKKMYVFCTINMYLTTPEPIYAGDRPKLDINYIRPNWKTEYQLKGFIMACVGKDISDIEFTCMNCLPDMRMLTEKVTKTEVRLTVPNNLRKSIQVTYRCTGYSNRYDSVSLTVSLYIIVSEYTDIDNRNLFFLYGEDHIKCVSQFTVQKKTTAVREEIIMPIMVQVNAEPILNKNGTNKSVLLKSISEAGTMNSFQACCPHFGAVVEYSCLGAWKAVKVAKNYRVRYNLEITEIFPGNLLKCFICVNFTSDVTVKTCDKENKIRSLISMTVIYPDGRENTTSDQSEVHAPVEELKPSKDSYYKITDYVVSIGCKVRGVTIMKEIKMKSCNLNPPKIQISPPDKTMFLVGDIFSCTTESVNCKNGLIYMIYVQRGGDPAEKKNSHSFTLALRHTGNNIHIKCAAGEGDSVVDLRLIRVEAGPYNVSIPNVMPMMVYGNYFRCLSSGFPPPSIKWTQLKGGSQLRISESFMLVGPWDYSGDYMIQCEAKNKRGSVVVTASFKVFNPRIVFTDHNPIYYLLVILMTVVYLGLLLLSLVVIFQENFFGVPFFSRHIVDPTSINMTSKVGATPLRTSVADSQVSSPLPDIGAQ